jgi:hypothetical protein
MPLCSRDLDPRERQLLQLFQDHVVFVALEKHRHAYASAALIDKRPRGLMLFISRTLVTAKRNDQTSVASKRCIERSARDENALQAGAELRRLRDERIGRADDDDAIGRVDDELPGRLQEIKGIPRSRCLEPARTNAIMRPLDVQQPICSDERLCGRHAFKTPWND